MAKFKASALGAVCKDLRAEQYEKKPDAAPGRFSIFPQPTWQHENPKARIETTGAKRGVKKILWQR